MNDEQIHEKTPRADQKLPVQHRMASQALRDLQKEDGGAFGGQGRQFE